MAVSAGGKAARGGGKAAREAKTAPPVVDRITVALIRKVAEDLQRLQDITGLSKTDVVNRAISLYAFIESEREAGNGVYVRDHKTNELQRVHFMT